MNNQIALKKEEPCSIVFQGVAGKDFDIEKLDIEYEVSMEEDRRNYHGKIRYLGYEPNLGNASEYFRYLMMILRLDTMGSKMSTEEERGTIISRWRSLKKYPMTAVEQCILSISETFKFYPSKSEMIDMIENIIRCDYRLRKKLFNEEGSDKTYKKLLENKKKLLK